jgi:uncharacterized protein (DUF488 family)
MAKRKPPIATIGYQGAKLADFLATLAKAEVELLIDVREIAFSHRREFMKTALAGTLERAGIAYRHMKALGTPKPGRDAAKAGDRAGFRRHMLKQLGSPAGKAALAEAATLAKQSRVCLLCMEHDHRLCHRSEVARRLARATGAKVHHLDPVAPQRKIGSG